MKEMEKKDVICYYPDCGVVELGDEDCGVSMRSEYSIGGPHLCPLDRLKSLCAY